MAGCPHFIVSPEVQEVCHTSTVEVPETLFEGLPASDKVAIESVDPTEAPLTYDGLRAFILGYSNLSLRGIQARDVVAVMMPNGPEFGVAVLACACQCVAAPLDPSLAEADLRSAIQQLKIKHIIAMRHSKLDSDLLAHVCLETGCKIHGVVKSGGPTGTFQWENDAPSSDASVQVPMSPCWTRADEPALVLRTSGTTSRPKVVPLTPRNIYIGAVSLGRSLGLTPTDRCINAQPYFHIGGLALGLFSTLFTGGSVICAPGFDPARFVHWLEQLQPTWYSSVPTMHKAVLLYCQTLPNPPKHQLRFVRSGSSNLPDLDARELKRLFGCKVYDTYNMTECMPLVSPPLEYDLEKPGTVGVPSAPSVRIANEGGAAVAYGKVGEVCVSGSIVFDGYLDNDEANATSFFTDNDECSRRWFRTGDIGHLDREGFLFLTGRSKELIKRGGEQVSPFEVEEALEAHPAVRLAVACGVPNEFWGEEVAAAVVLKPDPTVVSAQDLISFASSRLVDGKLPRQIVFLASADSLPKTSTGKYIRVGLHRHLGLLPVDLRAAENVVAVAPEAVATKRELKPHKAVYGLRYFISLAVMFYHIGTFPMWMERWRLGTQSMDLFFLLAGFLLTSSTTRPIADKFSFYKSRIVAAHPLYLLAVLFGLIPLLVGCPPGGGGVGTPEYCYNIWQGSTASFSGLAFMVFFAVFAQLAWPWGLLFTILGLPSFASLFHGSGMLYATLWFSSAYYFCVLLFPFLHSWLTNWEIFKVREMKLMSCKIVVCFLVVMLGLVAVANAVHPLAVAIADDSFVAYAFPPLWAATFFLGMLTWKCYEVNRCWAESTVWSHWGKTNDAISVTLILSLALLSCLPSEESARIVGALWANPVRISLPLLCIWIYGLATGQGYTAWFLGSDVLVRYISPASYSIYLFHWPIAELWRMVFHSGSAGVAAQGVPSQASFRFALMWLLHTNSDFPEVNCWEWILLAALTTIFAMFVTHVVNPPLTAAFMRCLDACCCRAFCGHSAQKEEETQDISFVVADSVRNLTGSDVHGATRIEDCGLDSFGAGALIGLLHARLAKVHLTAIQIYQLETIGSLVAEIERQLEAACIDLEVQAEFSHV